MSANTITLKFSYLNHEREQVIEKTLKAFLLNIQKENLFFKLSYIVKEIVGNANKANLKRIHFERNNLDINNLDDYHKGLETFKEHLLQNYDAYSEEAEKLGFYVKVYAYVNDNVLNISIINNNRLLPIELERINISLSKAKKYQTIEQALIDDVDTHEGGGLGLILIILMLKKLGIEHDNLLINDYEDDTLTEIQIPFAFLNIEDEEYISDIIKQEINDIPQLPEHIRDLQQILSNPNSNFNNLAHIINKDPVLIADILKLANSSLYLLPHKIKTIEEAVRQIGFKGIKNLILTHSARKILLEKYDRDAIMSIMEHSVEVTFYSFMIAKKYNLKEALEDTFTPSMLHDFGKIIILTMDNNTIEKISNICQEKGINVNILENLTDGFNHSLVGSKLVEKWNFPEDIIEIVKYHHSPSECSDKYRSLVYLVYLANIIYYYGRGEFFFHNIDEDVLSSFELGDEKVFHDFAINLYKEFEKQPKPEL